MRGGSTRIAVQARLAAAALLAGACVSPFAASANPVGATVSQGTASFSSQGSQLTIRTSDRTFINWQSFNIGLGQTTDFIQPSSSSLVWNRINDANPSQILGNLNANGYVVLQNQSGFYIGGQASITTHGLILTTAPIPMPDLSSGGPWDFNAPPPAAKIINYGQINLDKGGSVFLIAHDVENHGTVSAPEGNVGLYAGKEVLVSERPNGLGLSAKVILPEGSVDNSGKLIADAGTIAVHAQVVNQGGLVQANSLREVNGTIELVASDAVNLGPGSVISAKGDTGGVSPGGSVVIQSGKSFSDQATSTIDVSGGPNGGNGGQLEISAALLPAIHSSLNARALPGFTGGGLTIDPTTITLDDVQEADYNSQIINGGFSQFSVIADYITLVTSWATPAILSQLSLKANDDITLGTSWTVSSSLSQLNLAAGGNIFLNGNSVLTLTAPDSGSAALNMSAGNNITFGTLDANLNVLDTGSISAGNGWNVSLNAGTGFVATPQQPAPASGSDGIYLIGSSSIKAGTGNISLSAANEVQVGWAGVGNTTSGTASINTTRGGSIAVTTQYGDVDTGQNSAGYVYSTSRLTPAAPFYYSVSSSLGGISTAAGGNVTINAGGNVSSYMPNGTISTDAGSGAFGPQPGNVSITAGGSVFGHYVVANGVGTITAGQDVGNSLQNVALSLIKGSWNLYAPNGNIYLQEVRNPNGTYNTATKPAVAAGNHLFDYDPQDSVGLAAGNGVYLTGANVPRLNNEPVPIIYPPTLDIQAGAGGVNLLSSVILFPSPYGDLNLTTTAGGNLAGNGSSQLIMSDSSQRQWKTGVFDASDYGSVPIELNNPNPVMLNISGNMENFTLFASKKTWIKVDGDMLNCNFSGENLHAGDKTIIDVAGQIFDHGVFTFVPLKDPPTALQYSAAIPQWASIFYLALDPSVTAADLVIPPDETAAQFAQGVNGKKLFPGGSPNPGFVYDSATQSLGFAGQMRSDVLAKLDTKFLTVLVYDSSGNPVVEGDHLKTQKISWVDPLIIEQLSNQSQDASTAGIVQSGYRIGGPGEFDIHAGSISLGNAVGIFSCGVSDAEEGAGRYNNLVSITPKGATLNIKVDGDIDILTSTIAGLGGGNVNVTSGGSMNLGSQGLFDGSTLPSGLLPDPASKQEGYGIMATGAGADVNVIAGGDINVQSSRIAAYNGGNIFIESTGGSVNAGTGGSSASQAFLTYIDPVTGKASFFNETVFGSGILANTLAVPPAGVPSADLPGNITILTPRGNIIASQGGILQEALNGNVSAGPTVTLTAGTPATPGSPGFVGNIDLGDTGVIGGTVNVTASGNISGLVISRQNSTINAAQNFNGTVLSGGTASLAAGGTVSGIVIGIAGVSASGSQGVTATLLSQNVSVNGGGAASTLGTSATPTAAATSAAATANDTAQQQVAGNATSEDDLTKKKGKSPVLTRRVGRVTVILPKG